MTSVASAGVQGFSTIGILQSLRSSKTSDIGAVLWMALHDSGVANLKAMWSCSGSKYTFCKTQFSDFWVTRDIINHPGTIFQAMAKKFWKVVGKGYR